MDYQNKYRELHLHQEKSKSTYQNANEPDGHRCTFCGAEMDEDERFCSECGNPRDGIRCPNCGTLCHRSFCSQCNTPLNEMAREAVRLAKADPVFQKAERLAAEMAELEKQILEAGVPKAQLDTMVNVEARKAAGQYADLFAGVSTLKVPDAPQVQSKPKSRVLTGDVLKAAINAYKEKADELQKTVRSMLPPPSATPEEQRNFFCARKIMSTEMRAVAQEWVCNFCGCHHSQPSQCTRPELGGEWIFVNKPTPVAKIIYG